LRSNNARLGLALSEGSRIRNRDFFPIALLATSEHLLSTFCREAFVKSSHTSSLRLTQFLCLVIVPFAVLGLSCSKGLQSVSGKVLHKGQPIKGAVVTLHPKGGDDIKAHKPSGITSDDGTFTLSTGQDSGATPGEYVVTVVWLQQPASGKKTVGTDGPPDPVDQFQGRFANPKTSKLTAIIKAGVKELDPIVVD
jgi:hypothetical protein